LNFVTRFFQHRVTRRFLLLLFTLWLGASLLFWGPRLLGQNISRAGLFTSTPDVQVIVDVINELETDISELRGNTTKGGAITPFDAEQIDVRVKWLAELKDETRLYRPSEADAFERHFKFNQPQIVQYWHYISALSRFDLGRSQRFFPSPVFSVIRNSLVWTLMLVAFSTVIAFLLGSLIGGIMGWIRRSNFLKWVFLPILGTSAVPYYLLGWLLIWFLAFKWGLFPLQGGWDRHNPSIQPGWDVRFILSALHHAVLPALSIIVASTGFWAISMRGTIVSVLENDYIAFGTAKGLHPRHLFFAYGMRNSLLPQLTGLAGSLGSIVSGVLLVEIVFTYPGLGFLIRLALTSKDYALVAGIGFVILALLAVFLFVLDLALPLLDQRLKNRGNW